MSARRTTKKTISSISNLNHSISRLHESILRSHGSLKSIKTESSHNSSPEKMNEAVQQAMTYANMVSKKKFVTTRVQSQWNQTQVKRPTIRYNKEVAQKCLNTNYFKKTVLSSKCNSSKPE